MNRNDLLTFNEAADLLTATPTAMARMLSEGLLIPEKIDGEDYMLPSQVEWLKFAATHSPVLLTCECVDGPCECDII